MKFTNEQIEFLKYYVYMYMDPDTKEMFYVGKRQSRIFAYTRQRASNVTCNTCMWDS